MHIFPGKAEMLASPSFLPAIFPKKLFYKMFFENSFSFTCEAALWNQSKKKKKKNYSTSEAELY